MKLVTYIENKYQESTLAAHNSAHYALWLDSEVKALHQILNGIRIVLKWTHIVLFPLGYLAVLLGISKEPKPVLTEMAAKQKEAEAIAKKMAAEVADNVSPINKDITPIQPA